MRGLNTGAALFFAAVLLSGPIAVAQEPSGNPSPPRNAPSVPEGTRVMRDIPYADDGNPAHLLDLYLPAEPPADSKYPVIVWIHGGGWRQGSKENCRALPLIEAGYAVASVSYRLSTEAQFPAQIHDCKAALRWLRANAAEYNLDSERVGVWGSSAGGHLAALMGTTGDDPNLEGEVNAIKESTRVKAVCDFFGPTDLLAMPATNANPDEPHPVTLLLGGPPEEKRELAAQASPLIHVSKDDPPFLIVHGDQDAKVPHSQSLILHEALELLGCDSTLRIVEGAGHGVGGPEIIAEVRRWFDEKLKP